MLRQWKREKLLASFQSILHKRNRINFQINNITEGGQGEFFKHWVDTTPTQQAQAATDLAAMTEEELNEASGVGSGFGCKWSYQPTVEIQSTNIQPPSYADVFATKRYEVNRDTFLDMTGTMGST
jgi:hypothetical protein